MPNRHLLLAGMLLMGTATSATPALQGVWSGDRHILTVTNSGARLETDCAFAEFPAPAPDSRGHFKVEGRFHPDTAGPQPGDKPAPGQPASLEGTLDAGTLQVTLSPKGHAPQKLTLQRGQHVKLIRCL
jgi:hypothetical protein